MTIAKSDAPNVQTSTSNPTVVEFKILPSRNYPQPYFLDPGPVNGPFRGENALSSIRASHDGGSPSSAHLLDIRQLPSLVEQSCLGTVQAEDQKEALAGWKPIGLHACWSFGAKVDVRCSISILFEISLVQRAQADLAGIDNETSR
jgi:hypothetical protein